MIPLKVLADNGKGNSAWVESALQWVIDNATKSPDYQITVVNLSLGDGQNHTMDASNPSDKISALIKSCGIGTSPSSSRRGTTISRSRPRACRGTGHCPELDERRRRVDANIGGVQ